MFALVGSELRTRKFLLQQYGFNCTCAVCSLPDELSRASDKRLNHLTELHEHLARWGHANIEGEEAIEVVRKIWDVGEEEGYWSERGRLAADAVWVAAGHSELVQFFFSTNIYQRTSKMWHFSAEATRQWATLAARWYGYELGVDSDYVQEMDETRLRPETHRAWGTRNKMLVGGPNNRQ